MNQKTKFKQTEIGMIPEDWEVKELQKVCLNNGIQTGPFGSQLHNRDYVIKGTPIITVEHLGDNRIVHNDLPKVSEVDRKRLIKYSINEGDIIFSRVGSVDRRAIAKKSEEGWLFSGRCLRVRTDQNKINPSFLSYFFGLETFKERIRGYAVGATMPSLNTKLLSEMNVIVPPIVEQHQIAKILSDLDSKIELLQQQNKTLEAIGQALFKHWFVDFEFPNAEGKPYKSSGGEMVESELGAIPKNWKVTVIENVCKKSTSGGTPSRTKKEYFKGDINWFKTKELSDLFLLKSEELISKEAIDKSSAKMFPKNSVLMAIYASPTVGKLGILSEDSTFNQATCGFIVDDELVTKEYLFLYLLSERKKLNNLANGAAQQNLSVSKVNNYPIIEPKKEVMDKFRKATECLFDKLLLNIKLINNLQKTRDLLLPKLMSGKIRVVLK